LRFAFLTPSHGREWTIGKNQVEVLEQTKQWLWPEGKPAKINYPLIARIAETRRSRRKSLPWQRLVPLPAKSSETPRRQLADGEGFEQVLATSNAVNGLGRSASLGAAKSGADLSLIRPQDPELATVMEAWPQLPNAIRRAILALIA
jgi:hypothetical protein